MLFKNHKDLFDGTPGEWKLPSMDIDLKENTKPHHGEACDVPHSWQKMLKKEIERLVKIGVLR